jgi:hypothetical protein
MMVLHGILVNDIWGEIDINLLYIHQMVNDKCVNIISCNIKDNIYHIENTEEHKQERFEDCISFLKNNEIIIKKMGYIFHQIMMNVIYAIVKNILKMNFQI